MEEAPLPEQHTTRLHARGFFPKWRSLVMPRAADEDEKRREYILNVILVGSVGMLAVLDFFVLFHTVVRGAAYHGVSFAVFSGIVVFFIVLHVLSRRGFFVAASYALVAAYSAGASYAAYEWGADLETALLGYALIIVVTSILLGTKKAFVVAGTIGAYLIALWYLQYNSLISIPKYQVPGGGDAVIFTAILFLITVVAWLSNREIEKSLTRARRSERALKQERDLLEVRVEERTRELRESELQQMEQLYQFAEFGQLSSGLFHDLLNLVNASLLQHERLAREATEDALLHARKVNARIGEFVKTMRRQLAREDVHEEFSVAEIIGQAMQLLAHKAKMEKVRISFSGSDARWFCNPFRFHQVVMNLVLNAIESYGPTEDEDGGDRGDRDNPVLVEAERHGADLVLRVTDHGCGIAPQIREKIFAPFFTTKHGANGMGIGLATVKKIIEHDFHGSIFVESAPGKGTTFTVALRPAADPVGAGAD